MKVKLKYPLFKGSPELTHTSGVYTCREGLNYFKMAELVMDMRILRVSAVLVGLFQLLEADSEGINKSKHGSLDLKQKHVPCFPV